MGMVQHHPALNRPTDPVCSVCIANYNGVPLLDDCLQSVLSQIGDHSIEIIVHDDASTDESVAWLRRNYPCVDLLSSSENVGFCISNNRMVEHARGTYILLLNNDASLASDALTTLLGTTLDQHPEGIITLPQYDWESGKLVDRGCMLDPFYNPVPNIDPRQQHVAMVIGACLWIPRALWFELGGFPEWFKSIGEDLYLCCRARLAGYPVQVTANSHYRHRQGTHFGGNRAGAGGLATTYRRRRLSERNKTFAMVLCTPTALLCLVLPLHLLLLTLEGITLSLARHDARLWREVYASVWRMLWKEMPRLRIQRRLVQSTKNTVQLSYSSGFVWRLRKLDLLMRHGAPEIR